MFFYYRIYALKTSLLLYLLLFFALSGLSQPPQVDSPYHINGSAYKENCNCYTLTTADNFRSGSVWNINKIDLRQPFDFRFDVNLGCIDANGADGMVFVLQPISTNIGSTGGGIGFEGITPSVGVMIDTWQNNEDNDPGYDHISINLNGDINHNSSNNLSGTVTALANNDNIEDCQWHILRVTWNPVTKIIAASMDGIDRVSANIDLVSQVFANDPLVFWGFSAATGGSINHQRFCTSLRSTFEIVPSSETCAPQRVEFKEKFSSFGSIVKTYWDFGDGSFSNEKDPPPHAYPSPGIYMIGATVLGNNGCWSDTFKHVITIGSIPVAGFASPDTICGNSPLSLVDTSFVHFGTINEWNWVIDGVAFSGKSPPPLPVENKSRAEISLAVKTKEGCESQTIQKTVALLELPDISLPDSSDNCVGDELLLNVISTNPDNPVISWQWIPAVTNQASGSYRFKPVAAGQYMISVAGRGENGCMSDTLSHSAAFYQTKAYAGRDTIAAENQPVQLSGTGGTYYRWSPAGGLNDPEIADPLATNNRETTYVVTAYSPAGCETTDSVTIRIYKGPEIYMPTAFSPNGDGRNERYRFIAVGMKTLHYFNIYNRWGKQVYNSLKGEGWDGTVNGTIQPTGTYTWTISGTDYNGKPYLKKGTFILIR